MSHSPQVRIRATYMRGGTSKGTFFSVDDLPERAREPGSARDQFLLRVVGSPDPYGKQIDGMGGATSSTSKAVRLSRSTRPEHDVDYLFGQVSNDQPFVDWSGNCGNIVAHVPVAAGEVVETGDFELDGVTFPAAEVELEFLDPAAEEDGAGGAMFPTGRAIDTLDVPGIGAFEATMINAGIPTIFLDATALGYTGTELQEAINGDPAALSRFETIRAHGALRMGLIKEIGEAARRQHTPKVAFVAPRTGYVTSSGKQVSPADVDVLVRALSMGKLHHAMMGTAAVAIATAAAIPGTVVSRAAGGPRSVVRFGHPSGTLRVGAEARLAGSEWVVARAIMSRSARILMDGWVHVPGDAF